MKDKKCGRQSWSHIKNWGGIFGSRLSGVFLQAQDWRAAGATGQLYGPRGRCSILPSDALHVCRVDRALDMYRGQLFRPFLSYVLTEHRR